MSRLSKLPLQPGPKASDPRFGLLQQYYAVHELLVTALLGRILVVFLL